MPDFTATPVESDVSRPQVPSRESLVVLTRDAALIETLKGLGSEHDIVPVDDESDLAGELVGKQTGVAIIDTSAVATAVGRLTETLAFQFPDLVLIVAGSSNDQTALAPQITRGTVYRFLHKPVSEQRVRLFVDAAWRRHGQELSDIADSTASAGVAGGDRGPLPRNILFIGSAVAISLLVTGGWFLMRKPGPAPVAKMVATTQRDEQFESLLTRAAAAVASGALVAPADQNAADLYKQALRRNGSDPRAAAGIEKVIGELLSAAEGQLGAHHFAAAQKLTEQARRLAPDHVRVAFLSAQIGKERERFVLNQARQAASSGHIEAAIAVLDGASQEDKQSTPVPEARQQLQAQKELEERLVAQARRALAAGTADAGVSRNDITELTWEAQRGQKSAKVDAMARLDDANISAVGNAMIAAQNDTQRTVEAVPAANLKLAKYVPPIFPVSARQRGSSGWVDVLLLVKADGAVADVIITGAEPVGVFEQAAVDAVRKWRYEPAERDGHAVDQRARLRIKFALDK